MVPTSAIQDMGGTSMVPVMRGDTTVRAAVTSGMVQGEWTKVQSSDLQSGDQVSATLVSTVVGEDENQGSPGAAGMLGSAAGSSPPIGGPPSGGPPSK